MRRIVHMLLGRLGFDLVSKNVEVGFELLLRLQRLRSTSPFHLLQIGAQDGVTGDSIYRHVLREDWEGVLVEPREAMFERLREAYPKRKGIALVRCAVAAEEGAKSLYALDPEDRELPAWAHGLGTFDLDVLLSHEAELPGLRDRIVEEVVSCRTWESLLSAFPLPKIDLLQIDAEGLDYELLRLFPFSRSHPGLVRYEHKHLASSLRVAAERLLIEHGYSPLVGPQDTVAFASSWPGGPDKSVASPEVEQD